MKLFTKYSRINVLATIAIFLIASLAYYISLHFVLRNQIDGDLKIEEKEIETFVKEHGSLPENISVKGQVIRYTPVNQSFTVHYFTTEKIVEGSQTDNDTYRQLTFGITANQQHYKVRVSKSLKDTNALIRSILWITFLTILLILFASYIINRVVLKRIWKPFYLTLATVKNFKVSRNQKLHFKNPGIDEFDFMNETLERITQQAQVDYVTLKTFSENAAHEMQTPLAVIRSKLDNLIQDESISEQQAATLNSAYHSIQKLSRLNQSLLLLAKIENNQYEEQTVVHLNQKIEEKISDFQELWQAQQISVTDSLKNVSVKMNKELSDILLNNLLSNATKHNYPGGTIDILLTDQHLALSNTSRQPQLEAQKVFHRFYKPSDNNEHNGLGLSIIKQICDASGLTIQYQFQQQQHQFIISW